MQSSNSNKITALLLTCHGDPSQTRSLSILVANSATNIFSPAGLKNMPLGLPQAGRSALAMVWIWNTDRWRTFPPAATSLHLLHHDHQRQEESPPRPWYQVSRFPPLVMPVPREATRHPSIPPSHARTTPCSPAIRLTPCRRDSAGAANVHKP